MDNKQPNPAYLVAGAAVTVGGALGRVMKVGFSAVQRLPGSQQTLATLERRGADALRTADEYADPLLRAAIRRVVRTVFTEVDFSDLILENVDLVFVADRVIEGVDLPRIIRDSTGSISTEAVFSVRSQGMHADDAVAGFVGRLLRRGHAETVEPGGG